MNDSFLLVLVTEEKINYLVILFFVIWKSVVLLLVRLIVIAIAQGCEGLKVSNMMSILKLNFHLFIGGIRLELKRETRVCCLETSIGKLSTGSIKNYWKQNKCIANTKLRFETKSLVTSKPRFLFPISFLYFECTFLFRIDCYVSNRHCFQTKCYRNLIFTVIISVNFVFFLARVDQSQNF